MGARRASAAARGLNMTTKPFKPELRGTDADREAEPSIRDALDKTEKGKPVGTS